MDTNELRLQDNLRQLIQGFQLTQAGNRGATCKRKRRKTMPCDNHHGFSGGASPLFV